MSSKTSTKPNSPTQDEPLLMKDIQFDTLEIEKKENKDIALNPRTPLLNIEEFLTYQLISFLISLTFGFLKLCDSLFILRSL